MNSLNVLNPAEPPIRPIGSRSVVFSGRLIQIVRQPMLLANGRELVFETAERSPGVRTIVWTGHSVLLNREWRHESEKWDYRLPGGKVFDDLKTYNASRSDPDEILRLSKRAATRELAEETGLSADHQSLELIAKSVCGATIEWDLYYYLLRLDGEAPICPPGVTEEGECISAAYHTVSDIVRFFLSGEICEDRSAAVLIRFLISETGARYL